MSDDLLREVALTLCERCIGGAGGECHTPGCALYMNRAPDVPVRAWTPGPSDDELERAVNAYHQEYHRHWRDGGDAQDHDEAHRCGLEAVLELVAPANEAEVIEAARELMRWCRGCPRPCPPEFRVLRSALDRSPDDASSVVGQRPKEAAMEMSPEYPRAANTARIEGYARGRRNGEAGTAPKYTDDSITASEYERAYVKGYRDVRSCPARWKCPTCGPLHGEQVGYESHSQAAFCSHCGLDVDPA